MTQAGDLKVTSQSVKVEWKIERFFYLPKTIAYELRSPPFTLSNAEWSLRLKPNGEKRYNSDWIAMYLGNEPSPSPITVNFTLGIKRADGSVLKSADFKWKFETQGEGYGTGKFILKSEFLSMRDVVDKDGTLTLYCEASVDGCEPVLQPHSLKAPLFTDLERMLNRQKLPCGRYGTTSTPTLFSLGRRRTTNRWLKKFFQDYQSREERALEAHLQLKIEKYEREVRELNGKLSVANAEKETAAVNMKKIRQDAKKNADGELSENLRELFRSRYECDTIVRVRDKEFLVHKAILAARSSVFRTMFETDMAEKKDGIVNIEDCDPAHFEDFLLFIYSGQYDIVRPSNALKLCFIADKYNVVQLKEACFQAMTKRMSAESVCDAVYLATLFDKEELLNTATDFFIENMGKIVVTQKWITFLTEHLTIANELLVKTANKK